MFCPFSVGSGVFLDTADVGAIGDDFEELEVTTNWLWVGRIWEAINVAELSDPSVVVEAEVGVCTWTRVYSFWPSVLMVCEPNMRGGKSVDLAPRDEVIKSSVSVFLRLAVLVPIIAL